MEGLGRRARNLADYEIVCTRDILQVRIRYFSLDAGVLSYATTITIRLYPDRVLTVVNIKLTSNCCRDY
jgi:hypothetical protein